MSAGEISIFMIFYFCYLHTIYGDEAISNYVRFTHIESNKQQFYVVWA